MRAWVFFAGCHAVHCVGVVCVSVCVCACVRVCVRRACGVRVSVCACERVCVCACVCIFVRGFVPAFRLVHRWCS